MTIIIALLLLLPVLVLVMVTENVQTLEWGAIGKFNLEHHRAQEWQGRNSSAGMSDFKAMLILSLSSEM